MAFPAQNLMCGSRKTKSRQKYQVSGWVEFKSWLEMRAFEHHPTETVSLPHTCNFQVRGWIGTSSPRGSWPPVHEGTPGEWHHYTVLANTKQNGCILNCLFSVTYWGLRKYIWRQATFTCCRVLCIADMSMNVHCRI